MEQPDGADAPQEIRERAGALAEYLLAVRALLDKPVRTVPAGDAYWHDDLPVDPAVELGPRQPGGSWLRVGRPAPPTAPAIPATLLRHLVWDLTAENPPTLPDDDGVRAAALDEWLAAQWRPWAVAHRRAAAVRALHDRLYDLRYRVDVDAARVELVWGHAVLDAPLGGEPVRYPLLATPVAIDYDPETTTVTVHPQGPPRLQVDALGGLDNRRVGDLLDLAGPGGQVEVDPWDAAERQEFARRALRRLGLDPVLRFGDALAEGPHVHDTGVLFLRPRQRMVRRFLEAERDRLATPAGGGVGALAGILAHEPSALRMPDDDPEAWNRTGERLLMPMATNDAQESIAARLAAHRTVAVQGPPGTGKTHTIRNLICHLVAHGKRVLVLAQKEDPLRVLRDGLPAEIQPLCLAVLGRSADQLVQLQIAARELSDRAATLDRSAAADEVARITADIDAAHDRFAAARYELLAVAEREATTYPIGGVPSSPAEVGEWLRRTEADGIVPDPVPPELPAPLTAGEFAVLGDLSRTIPPADRAHALADLPADGQLPAGEAVAAQLAALGDAGKVVERARDGGIDVDGARRLGPAGVDELATALRSAADTLARRAGSWTDRLGQLIRDPTWQAVWDEQVGASQRMLGDLGRRTAALSGHRVEIAAEHAAQPRRLLTQLGQIRERFAAGKPVRRLTHGELAKLVSDCQVDGEQPRTVADVDLLAATVERQQFRQQLAARWAEWGQRLGAPVPTAPGGTEPELWAGRLLAEALDALDWDSRRWPALRGTVALLVPACPRAVDATQLADLAELAEAAQAVFTVDRIEAERRAMTSWLGQATSRHGAAPVLRALAAAWSADDAVGWNAALAEIRRLWTIKPDATRYAALHARLAAVAPQWAGAYDRGEVPAGGAEALRGWAWRQAQTWFDVVTGAHGVDDDDLGRRLERARDQQRRLTGELVVGSAWLEVARTLDDRRKAALADWAAALRKIGKGTGKTAAHWQAAAQRAMAEAATAVPVWIMSVDRALEQFPGAGPIFDVVVVDEASQADIFALPVLALANRAVVVGDDQQIGPQLVGLPAERVNALIGTHLTPAGVPSAVHFDTESSLYDHAVRRSPQRILLTEHFRSVPAIIGFSSETYYDGKIQPLRAGGGVLGPAVTAIHVPDGRRVPVPEYGEVNVAEAEALVARAASIVADPAYQGRTIGVVSLLSTSGQALYLQHRLRVTLGADELERRALRVGDAYTFQGDERDVVLVSMVVATADGGIGAFTKRDYHRRVNVAASRARDQLFVFHSVQPGELHADDARAMLLSYVTRPAPVAPPLDGDPMLETDFTREVWRRLTAAGLHPVPRFRLGAYQIDFVVNAPDGRRLAIACDDRYRGASAFAAELRRQAILERVGNCVFVRLRASLFHRDPDRAMRAVFARASELGLLADRPAGFG